MGLIVCATVRAQSPLARPLLALIVMSTCHSNLLAASLAEMRRTSQTIFEVARGVPFGPSGCLTFPRLLFSPFFSDTPYWSRQPPRTQSPNL